MTFPLREYHSFQQSTAETSTTTSSKKKLVKKTAALSSLNSSTDLPLKLLPDGSNIVLEVEKIVKKKQTRKGDTVPVTQEVYFL